MIRLALENSESNTLYQRFRQTGGTDLALSEKYAANNILVTPLILLLPPEYRRNICQGNTDDYIPYLPKFTSLGYFFVLILKTCPDPKKSPVNRAHKKSFD